MRIAVLANLKENAPQLEGMYPDRWDDLDSRETVEGIASTPKSRGHDAAFLEASLGEPVDLRSSLREFVPDLCFNLSEGNFGNG